MFWQIFKKIGGYLGSYIKRMPTYIIFKKLSKKSTSQNICFSKKGNHYCRFFSQPEIYVALYEVFEFPTLSIHTNSTLSSLVDMCLSFSYLATLVIRSAFQLTKVSIKGSCKKSGNFKFLVQSIIILGSKKSITVPNIRKIHIIPTSYL